MSEHGAINLIFKVDTTTKELVGNIQIESRGFVYSSEVQKVHTAIVQFARKKYTDNIRKSRSVKDNLKMIKDELGAYVKGLIGREPMIVPSYVYINRDGVNDTDSTDDIVGMTIEE